MTEEVKIVFTGSDQGLFALYDAERRKVEQGIESLRKKRVEAAQAYDSEKRDLKDTDDLRRKGLQTMKSVETAQERYERQIVELRTQLKGGAIDQETFNRAVRKAKSETQDAGDKTGFLDAAMLRLIPTTLTLASALQRAATEQAKFKDEAEETALKLDKLTRKYQIQAGLNALQAKDARKSILKIARENAVDEDTAFAAATELVSQGFSEPEKTGALDAYLKTVSSSNQAERDPVALIQGVSQFLENFGLAKNGQNLMDIGVRSTGLFGDTAIQVGDLAEFSKSAGTFAGAGVSLEDTLSANTILRERMGAAEGATQGRNVVTAFQTFSADAGRSKLLKDKLGIDPTMIDLVGETLPQALGKLKSAIDALPKEGQAPALVQLFGKENLLGVQALFGGLAAGKFDKFAAMQRNYDRFVAGVNTKQSGPSAAANRMAIDDTLLELQKEEEAARRRLAELQLEQMDKENYQASGPMGDFAIGMGNFVRAPLLWAGANPELFIGPGGGRRIDEAQQSNFSTGDLQQALGANGGAVRELTGAIKDLATEMKLTPPAKPAAPRPPAAALGN